MFLDLSLVFPDLESAVTLEHERDGSLLMLFLLLFTIDVSVGKQILACLLQLGLIALLSELHRDLLSCNVSVCYVRS